MKNCSSCNKELKERNKSGFCRSCYYNSDLFREKAKDNAKKYYLKNKANILIKRKNPEFKKKFNEYIKEWRKKHPDKFYNYQKKYYENVANNIIAMPDNNSNEIQTVTP